jgi:hypothetical protein
MIDEEQARQPPGPPAKRRPSSMGSILRKTTGRTTTPSAPSVETAEEVSPGEAPAVAQTEPMRRLADVPWEELEQAVAEMCARLNVRGAVVGSYDLYAAVAGEWGKAHRAGE